MKRENILRLRMLRRVICGTALTGTLFLAACGNSGSQDTAADGNITPIAEAEPTTAGDAGEIANNTAEEEEEMNYAEYFGGLELAKSYKGVQNNNPIIEQHYGADPFALVYEDTVYFYMTADAYE